MHRPFVVAAVGVLAVSSLDAAGAAIEASEGALGPGAWALVVAAPWALGLGGGLALTARGVARISSLLAPLVDAARTHAVAHRASLGALALSGALGLGLAVGAAALAGSALVSAVRTPLYAALAVLLAADLIAGNSGQTNKLYLNDGSGGFAATGTAVGNEADQTEEVVAGRY